MSAFDRLISQIDAFIRKFYKNQLIKGALLFVGVLIISYLLVITLEYFGRFSSTVRGLLLFTFLGTNVYILWKYIVIPTLRLKSYGKRIDRYQASQIIGRFFPSISDRLLNTLQLSDQMDQNSADYELLNASVQQRSSSMNLIPFVDAVDLGESKRYLVWVLPIIAVFGSVGIFSPSLLKQGTERVVNFTETYVEEAPFSFELIADSRSIEEGEDFNFAVELAGTELPEKVFIKSSQGRFLLSKTAKNVFEGKMVQLRESAKFYFEANGFKSEEYEIDVVGKTTLGKLQATLVYPDYLGKDKEVIENASDLTVEEGTTVEWSVLAKNTSKVDVLLNGKKSSFTNEGFSFKHRFLESGEASLLLSNEHNGKIDTTGFVIDVIKDQYPTIQVEEVQDSLKNGVRYFSGLVGDDYGLGSLVFVYTINGKDGSVRTERLKVGSVYGTESPFDFAVDFRQEKITLEDAIEYYFVVSDNDGVNGSKSTKSRSFVYELPSLEELNEQREEEQEEIKKDLADILRKADKFKKDVNKLRKEAQNSRKSSWNKDNQVQQLQEDQQSLMEDLQMLQEEMQNSIEEKNQLSEMDEQLLEQQELINDLLEELMDDELKNLLDELQELMQKQDENRLEENLDNLEMSSEEMKDQLDRSLEMLKKLQVDEKIDDIEEELKALSKEQEELKSEMEDNKKLSEKELEEQEELGKKFEELKKDLEELDSLNNELKRPMELGLDEQKDKSDSVEEQLNEAEKNIEKNKGSKAGESQQNAADEMKEMAEQLDAMQKESNKQQQEEDMDALREILESLLILSLDQEQVMKDFARIDANDPVYRTYGRTQRRIVDNTKVVNDSLKALAGRQPKIAQFVDKELNQIKVNHELILEDIDERNVERKMGAHQQYVMTSYNNLALLLNEALQQMQQQMQNQNPGMGSCNKPGGKGAPKPGKGQSSGDMKEMLKKQLEQMKKGQKDGGKNPGGKKPGGQSPGGSKPGGEGQGLGLGNKQVAKMAAQQSAMRRRLEEMRNKMNKDGKGTGNQLNPLIQELEKQERDLVNKRLGNNLIERQKRILTRLLESEKALMERGLDEKRESKEGKNENNGNQIRFDEYNKEKLKQIELLRAVDPAYKKYYKDRANEYFNRQL